MPVISKKESQRERIEANRACYQLRKESKVTNDKITSKSAILTAQYLL
ncbi:hypothetical protein [Neobacillus drentensis]